MIILRNISRAAIAVFFVFFASHAYGQSALLQQRIQDAKAFEAEQARERQANQEAINDLQNQIDNINADPNRTEADNRRAEDLQNRIFDRQEGYRTDLDRFLSQPNSTPGPVPRKPNCGPQDNGSYILCEPIPLIDPVQKDPAALLRQLYILALILAGSVAFIQIVRGGILYSISGVVDGKNRAKSIFKGVAQGLALLMGSYVILNTINPALVTLRFPDADNYFPPVPSLAAQADAFGSATPEEVAAVVSQTVEEQKDRLSAAEAEYQATQSEIGRLQSVSKRTPEENARLAELRENAQEQSIAIKNEQDILKIFSSAEQSAKKDVYMKNIDNLEVQKAAESQDKKAAAAKETFQLRQEEIARLQGITNRTPAQNQQLSKLKADAGRDYATMKVEQDLSAIFNAAANDKK